MPSTLFISYSRTDAEVVARLRRALTALGAEIWIDHLRLTPGTPDWEDAIREGIQKSQWVIYAASPAAMQSPYVKGELRVAQRFKKPIIPFWVAGEHWEDCVPLNMTMTQYIDSRPTRLDKTRFDKAAAQLAATIGLGSLRATFPVTRPHPPTRPVKESSAAPGRSSTSPGGLTRRQVVIAGIATFATISCATVTLPRLLSSGVGARPQVTPTPRPGGELLWKYKIKGTLGAMAADNKFLYVVGADSNLHVLDILTGTEAWTFTTGWPPNPAQLPGTTISNGVAYFGVGNSGRCDFIALDVASRKPRWRARFDAIDKNWSGTPAVGKGVVCFGDERGFLYAARVSDGTILWQFVEDPATVVQLEYINSPVIADNVVYISRGETNLHALSLTTGREIWRFTATNDILAPPAVADDSVFVTTDDATLVALDVHSGAKLWAFRVTENNGSTTPPAVANGLVYVTDVFNALYAVDPATGSEVWETAATFATGPVVTNGVVYIGDSGDVRICAYDAKFGTLRWQYQTDIPDDHPAPNQINAQYTIPTVSNGVVYISSITSPIAPPGVSGSTIYAITA